MKYQMARQKTKLPPLVELKGPFIDALNNYTQLVIQLTSALDIVLKNGNIGEGPAKILRERLDAVQSAMFGESP